MQEDATDGGRVARPASPARALLSALLIAILLLEGCASGFQRHLRTTPDPGRRDRKSEFLNAHLRDGGFIAFTHWSVDSAGRVVSGDGRRLDADRRLVAEGPMSMPVDSVALFEATSTSGMPPLLKALTIIVVGAVIVFGIVLAAFAIACAADPKCFGSCPTFYASDGERLALMAEGFSASVAPSLEATDVDALGRARPSGRTLEVTMKNEALETHVVRSVRVLAVPRPAGARVFATPEGTYWETAAVREPRAVEGGPADALDIVRRLDGVERTSTVDSTDLARRETLELEFATRPGERVGLVVGSRQTLLTTYLFYETLAAMGGSAGRWLARLERGDALALDRSRALGRGLGGLEVQVREPDGRWIVVREFNETGPLATDVKLVPLPAATGDAMRVRLRMARGLYRIDWLAMARLERPAEPVALEPVEVRRGGAPDPEARAALLDSARTLVTEPGDAYTLVFELPEGSHELFLESRGYYLEWMRQRWIEQENPARLAAMMLDPARALRELAPVYAREQAALEDWFWRSRFAHP